jgi:C4-dicarboxylate-specific signal transduction histidine kinase
MNNPPACQAGAGNSLQAPAGSLHDSQATPPQAPRPMTMKELLASIAPEVNQPLAAIVANAEACLSCLGTDPPDLARVRKVSEHIVRDGHRACAVLSSIRAMFKRSCAGDVGAESQWGHPGYSWPHADELSWYDVILQIDLCKQLGCIRGNRIQLQQVLVNLIKNAIESMIDSVVRPL